MGDHRGASGRYALIEVSIIVLELAIGVGLLWERSRRIALASAVAMHLTFEFVARVDSIGWQMLALLLVFTRSELPRPAKP